MKSEIWFNCGNRFEISQLKSKFIIPHKVEFKRTSEGINIKLPTKNGEESCLVAGVVLLSACGGSRVPFWGCFTIESLFRYRSQRSFLSLLL